MSNGACSQEPGKRAVRADALLQQLGELQQTANLKTNMVDSYQTMEFTKPNKRALYHVQ